MSRPSWDELREARDGGPPLVCPWCRAKYTAGVKVARPNLTAHLAGHGVMFRLGSRGLSGLTQESLDQLYETTLDLEKKRRARRARH